VRELERKMIESLGYMVDVAVDGMDGWNAMRAGHYDLVVTDVVMPGLSGPNLAARLVQQNPGLRVLYMTGYSRNAVFHQGRLDEGVDLLQKPISQAQLATRVRAALDRKI